MAEEPRGSASAARALPDKPDIEWLRKEAKRQLATLRRARPGAKLADAQFDLAKVYGFASWRALKAHIDSLSVEGKLFAAARAGDVATMTGLLGAHPDALQSREAPYGWSLLHAAAHTGRLAVVDLLLARGLDVNAREDGDHTYAMHWAAAAGHLEVVQHLTEAGGDVVGHGDDHGLEIIGWATCWEGCGDAAHRAIADFLVGRGARHHIFSAIALDLADEVRRIVAADPSALHKRMSRNEANQTPLHFAVRLVHPAMVSLLLELGADPLAVDADGQSVPDYAVSPGSDRPVMEAIHRLTLAELVSADRGKRTSNAKGLDLVAALSLGDRDVAERLVRDDAQLLETGALHLLAKRNDLAAVRWLLEHGADVNARVECWGSRATPLHMAAGSGSAEIVCLLLAAGADPHVLDTRFESDASGWAEHFGRSEVLAILRDRMRAP